MINYYKKRGVIWHNNEKYLFDSKSKEHINWVINALIADIDSMLRFKLKNYFSNYYLLVSAKNETEIAGADWSKFLEYGTTDKSIIDLQNIGLPRHLAMVISQEYQQSLSYDGDDLIELKVHKLLEDMDKEKYKLEYKEIIEIYGIDI